MENSNSSYINAFDSLFTNNKIQMLKILLVYLPSQYQGILTIYIKFLELQHTILFLKQNPEMRLFEKVPPLSFDFLNKDTSSTLSLLEEILPFTSDNFKGKINDMIQMMQNMKQMQEMMDTFRMMQDMFPDGMEHMMDGMMNDFMNSTIFDSKQD